MYSQQPDSLELLRHNINDLIDRMKLQQQHNAIQDRRLSEHDNRMNKSDKMYQILQSILNEQQESIDFCVNKIREFDYLIDRNQKLEYREDPWSLDGDANCNSDID